MKKTFKEVNMKPFFPCPAADFTCPYCDANYNCMMYPEFDPRQECDEAWCEEEEEEEEE